MKNQSKGARTPKLTIFSERSLASPKLAMRLACESYVPFVSIHLALKSLKNYAPTMICRSHSDIPVPKQVQTNQQAKEQTTKKTRQTNAANHGASASIACTVGYSSQHVLVMRSSQQLAGLQQQDRRMPQNPNSGFSLLDTHRAVSALIRPNAKSRFLTLVVSSDQLKTEAP